MFNFFPFFTGSVKKSFGELFLLTGRLGRVTFLLSALFMLLLIFNLSNILHTVLGLFGSDFTIEETFIHMATNVFWIILGLMSVRRIHDVGYSAGALLLGFVPYVGLFIVIWLLWLPGDPDTNVYGAPVETFTFDEMLKRMENGLE